MQFEIVKKEEWPDRLSVPRQIAEAVKENGIIRIKADATGKEAIRRQMNNLRTALSTLGDFETKIQDDYLYVREAVNEKPAGKTKTVAAGEAKAPRVPRPRKAKEAVPATPTEAEPAAEPEPIKAEPEPIPAPEPPAEPVVAAYDDSLDSNDLPF